MTPGEDIRGVRAPGGSAKGAHHTMSGRKDVKAKRGARLPARTVIHMVPTGIERPGGPRHRGIIMSRVIAVVACGFSLAACTSSWMPSFEMPSFGTSGAPPASVAVESDPPGAEARVAGGGASCRTPCRLNVSAAGPFTVTVALNGYLPQSVPVTV